MEFKVISKKEIASDFDKKAIKLQHIRYFDPPYHE